MMVRHGSKSFSRRAVLSAVGALTAGTTAGCTAPTAPCPTLDFPGEEVCSDEEPAVGLTVRPAEFSFPVAARLTVRNRTDRKLVLYGDANPFVFRWIGTTGESETAWTGPIGVGRRLVACENVTVTDEHTFTRRLSFSDRQTPPGAYALCLPGHLVTPAGGERRINLVARVRVTE
jgi:hypothetical protein